MRSPQSLQITREIILPGDSEQMVKLKKKINEIIEKLDEAYRLLHMDVRIMDFREKPPHVKIDHADWKWYQDPTTGDLQLWHRINDNWYDSGWHIEGLLTRPTPDIT